MSEPTPYGVEPNGTDYYGSPGNSDTKPLRERLREYYSDSDFVKVKNIDSKPLTYQFMNPSDQELVQYSVHGDLYNKRPPHVVTLQPGETRLCPAYEADLMIENLIKQLLNTRQAEKIKKGLAKADSISDWTEPNTQVTLINEIFLGKQDLVNQYNENINEVKSENDPTTPSNPEAPRLGRPPKNPVASR